MAVDLWGPGGGQGPRGAVAPWSVKVQPRTGLSGGQPTLRRGGSLEWSLCTGLGEGQPQASGRDRYHQALLPRSGCRWQIRAVGCVRARGLGLPLAEVL